MLSVFASPEQPAWHCGSSAPRGSPVATLVSAEELTTRAAGKAAICASLTASSNCLTLLATHDAAAEDSAAGSHSAGAAFARFRGRPLSALRWLVYAASGISSISAVRSSCGGGTPPRPILNLDPRCDLLAEPQERGSQWEAEVQLADHTLHVRRNCTGAATTAVQPAHINGKSAGHRSKGPPQAMLDTACTL